MTVDRIIVGAGGGGGKGGKGGSSHVPTESPNSLRSKQYARILDLVSEGPIAGLVDGDKSIYYDGVPLMNPDFSYNFSAVSVQARYGYQDQAHIPGFYAGEDESVVNVEVKFAAPVVRTITASATDAVRVTVGIPALSNQDVKTGDLTGHYVTVCIDVQNNGGGYVNKVTDQIQGKTLSRYQRSYEIVLPGPGPWDIKVRRGEPEPTEANINGDLWFDSFTRIVYDKLKYPNSALFGTMIDASQFSAIPNRAYDLKGMLCKIPNNYDPLTRQYTGTWDGISFNVAWTDNPAWCFYDLITNERYGLGDFINTSQVDVWSLYEISQYCDQLVPDGFGGQEPRFTCNLYLQVREEAYKVIYNMASIFRAIVWWGSNSIIPVQDAPSDPVMLYSNANVLDGMFTYSSSALTARHTVALVTWNDPNDQYKQKIEYVEDAAAIAKWGVREAPVVAFGCTSRGQAHRVGKWLLLSEQVEDETVQFSVSVDSAFVYPGAIIKTLDNDRAGTMLGGRVLSATTSNIVLDRTVTLPSGTNKISCVLPDGSVQERTISTGAGNVSSVTVSSPFTTAPISQAMWVIQTSTVYPQLWRVMTVGETDEGNIAIAALAYNPSKYAAVEQGLQLQELPVSVIDDKPAKPTNIVLSDSIRRSKSGDIVTYLTITWDQADRFSAGQGNYPVFGELRYSVDYRPIDGNWTTIPSVFGTTVDVEGVRDGVMYEIAVRATNSLGYESQPATASYTVVGKNAPPSDVTGFVVKQQGANVVFGVDPVLDEDLDAIEIRYSDQYVSDGSQATPLVYILRGYTATHADVPPGIWKFWAYAKDTSGNYSVNPATVVQEIDSLGYELVRRVNDQPDFLGTPTGFVRHWTGCLVPDSQSLASAGATGWEVFDQAVYNPVTSSQYVTTELTKGIDTTTRYYTQVTLEQLPGASSLPSITNEADFKTLAGSYDGYEAWVSGSAFFASAKSRVTLPNTGQLAKITAITQTADNFSRVESAQNASVSAAGTTISFSEAFNLAPNLQITIVGGASALSVKVTAKSAVSFTVYCYNSSGTAVDGVIDWRAEGV